MYTKHKIINEIEDIKKILMSTNANNITMEKSIIDSGTIRIKGRIKLLTTFGIKEVMSEITSELSSLIQSRYLIDE